jgi:hypothetical protein
MNLESKRPPRPLFRVGRDDDAWAIPDWAYAKEDGTFGNRLDDPMGVYRVLYASSQRRDASSKPWRVSAYPSGAKLAHASACQRP